VCIIFGPKADATEKEWPVDGTASIWMRSCQAGVVLEHEQLQFSEFSEEIHLLGDFGWGRACSALDIT